MATAAAGRVARDGTERLGDEAPVTGTSRAARRYARAVFELAKEEGRVEEWQRNLFMLRELLSEPTVAAVISNPTIPPGRRMELIKSLEGIDPEATNLAKLLIDSHRVQEIAGVAEEFDRLADAAAGRVRATVTTAVELTADDRSDLARQLSRRLSKEVSLTAQVDPMIVAGLKLQYGDRLIDATVATKLQQLRRRLADAS